MEQDKISCVINNCVGKDDDELAEKLRAMNMNTLRSYINSNCLVCSDKRSKNLIVRTIVTSDMQIVHSYIDKIRQSGIKSNLMTYLSRASKQFRRTIFITAVKWDIVSSC